MAVRKLERRVPGGFDNVDALGYAVKSEDKKYALVSFLGETLRIGHLDNKRKFDFINHYAVFVNTTDENAVSKYKWKVQFFNELEEEILIRSAVIVDEFKEGVFKLELSPSEIDRVINNLIIEIRISVILEGTGSINPITLNLIHRVMPFRQDLEELSLKKSAKNATAGNKKALRWVGNYFATYIHTAYTGELPDTITNIPPALLTAVVYHRVLSNLGKPRGVYNISPVAAASNSKHGICNLHPAFAAMFITKDTDLENTFSPVTPRKTTQANHLAFKKYNELTEGEQIDLYNLLRFPKSNIKVCLLSLLAHKHYHNGSGSKSDPNFRNQSLSEQSYRQKGEDGKKTRRCIMNIVSELLVGLYEKVNPIPVKSETIKLTDNVYNAYIQKLAFYPAILETTNNLPVEYKEIKIKLLDIRSGRPIRHAKTKKIFIKDKDGNEISKHDFAYDTSARSVTGISLRSEARRSLERFGYKKNNVNFNAAHAAYWNARKVNTINVSATSQQYIVEDYRALASTDEQGILTIRLPKATTDTGTINIELGFWEFPIVLEALDNDANRISRGAKNASPTEFEVEWSGNQTIQTTQTLSWEKHIKGQENFGWRVANSTNKTYPIKVAEKLEVNFADPKYSKYYNNDNDANFVLFGMQWCQPVWDEFDDEPADGVIKTVVQNDQFKNRHIHLASYAYDMGTGNKGAFDRYGGKGYGKFENGKTNKYDTLWRSTNGHQGYDFYARSGYLMFAIHGGKYARKNSGTHVIGKLLWGSRLNYQTVMNNKNVTYKEYNTTTYLHLTSHIASNNTVVMAGQQIALSGRTGNLGITSRWPSHLHLNVGSVPKNAKERKYYPKLTETLEKLYPHNQYILLDNNAPIVLPCYNEVTQAAFNPGNCRFRDTKFINTCWAAAELKCPFMHEGEIARSSSRLQVLLRYLNEEPYINDLLNKTSLTRIENFEIRKNNDFFHPGKVDGQIGNAPQAIPNSILAEGAVLTFVENEANYDKGLKKIKFKNAQGQEKESWIDSGLLNNKKVRKQITNLPQARPGKTRYSIYTFKKKHVGLDLDNYYLNFEMQESDWGKLEEVLNIEP